MTTAAEFKAKGNAALQAKNFSEAIEHYTSAIRLDGANHVYFSNRSAAYLSKGDAHNALEDANACIGLNPEFAKGYSRKGAALHSLKRYNDSIAAFNDGLAKFPNDAGLKKGLDSVQQEKDNPMGSMGGMGGMGGGPPGGGLFSPQMMAQMALDPKLRPYLSDPDVMGKIKMVQSNPNLLPTILSDPKMMQLLSHMMGGAGLDAEGMDSEQTKPQQAAPFAPTSTPATAPATDAKDKKDAAAKSEQEEEEDFSHLTPEERKVKENQKAAVLKKEEGNGYYKKKQFDKALETYDEAIQLDPKNMTFLSNKAAVYLTMKKYDECIDQCLQAVQIGKDNMAPYEDRAKCYVRAAKAYQKVKNLDKAIEMCNEAQLECYDKATQRLLKTLELENKKRKALEYLDDDKAEAAKQKGNEFFREKKWGEAVQNYEEAVKRAPKNAPIRNNLSAALCKIMDFTGAKRHIEEALEIDPKYVKAWARKGDIEIYMKEYHKAMDSYKMGLSIEENNPQCREGLQKVTQLISYGRQNMTEEQKREQAEHAMADPEIQAILQDPVLQQVLRDFKENPAAAQSALADPMMRGKIERLIAAGIIETG